MPYSYESDAQEKGGLWAAIQEAFMDLFFDEVDDDRPIGISRLSHQTFTGNATTRLPEQSLPPRRTQQPAASTGNVFADGLLSSDNPRGHGKGQFVQPRSQFYKNSSMFAQDFRYEKLAGQKPKAGPQQEYY